MPIYLVMLSLQAALYAATPTAEAQIMGRRLAASGPLAAILPMMIEKDLGQLADENRTLTPSERESLLALGRAQGRAGIQRLTDALGDSYARHLSLSDLRILVAQNENAVARRWHAAEPAAIVDAMRKVGELDLKKSVAAAFCKQTGKLCERE